MTARPFCVCVPARNEGERLPVLLNALAAQTVAGCVPVAICLNNCDDDSAAVVAACADRFAGRLRIVVDACTLAASVAHAGTARGRAMRLGERLLPNGGALLSTDADCRPPNDWIGAILDAMDRGADIVGGRIELDEAEPVTTAVREIHARFAAYWSAVRAIEDAIDPSPCDPPPRHGDHTGASVAIDRMLFGAIGGVPALPVGEDRAMVAQAVAAGGRLVHPPAVWTRVSPRRDGRATGGMATDMATWDRIPTTGAPLLVPALVHWQQRATWRRDTRRRVGIAAMLAREAGLPPMPEDMPLPTVPADASPWIAAA